MRARRYLKTEKAQKTKNAAKQCNFRGVTVRYGYREIFARPFRRTYPRIDYCCCQLSTCSPLTSLRDTAAVAKAKESPFRTDGLVAAAPGENEARDVCRNLAHVSPEVVDVVPQDDRVNVSASLPSHALPRICFLQKLSNTPASSSPDRQVLAQLCKLRDTSVGVSRIPSEGYTTVDRPLTSLDATRGSTGW